MIPTRLRPVAVALLALAVVVPFTARCGGGGGGGGIPGNGIQLTVTKTANPTSVEAPGGNVQFTVVVSNGGTESFTVNSLNDSVFGNLNTARCPGAVVGQVVAAGANRTCQFTTAVNGTAGTVHANIATAVVENGSTETEQASDGATVNIVANLVIPAFVADTPSPSAPTISLAPGTVTDDQFQVLVRVTQINNFFGASLRIQFDPLIADFLSSSSTGSVLGGAPTLFDVFEPSSGVIDVVATRQGAGVAGLNVSATSLLVTLTFRALQNTVGAEPFDVIAPRSVQVCPTAGQPCQKLADGALAWSGGDLTVN